MRLIDRTVPLPAAWPPPRTALEFEAIERYLVHRDPVGYRIHSGLALVALVLAPLWQAPSSVAFALLGGYALLRTPNTWRAWSALLSCDAVVAWTCLGLLLMASLSWAPFGTSTGFDHLGAWRVMLFPLLLLPVLPSRRWLVAAALAGCMIQFGLMLGDDATTGQRWLGPLRNVNLTAFWGACLASGGLALLLRGRWPLALIGFVITAAGAATTMLTHSRGGFLALTASCSGVALLGILAARGRSRWIVLARAGCVVAIAVGTLLWHRSPTVGRLERNLERSASLDPTARSTESLLRTVDPARFHLWRLAATHAMERPVVGWGLGSYRHFLKSLDPLDRAWWATPEVPRSMSSVAKLQGSHSAYFRVACEQGLVGLAVLAMAVGATLARTAALARIDTVALGGFGVTIAWLAYAGTEDAHLLTRGLVPIALCLSLSCGLLGGGTSRRAEC